MAGKSVVDGQEEFGRSYLIAIMGVLVLSSRFWWTRFTEGDKQPDGGSRGLVAMTTLWCKAIA